MIRFENVAFEYARGEPLFRGLTAEFGLGLTLLVGLNGAGKSTLLKLAAGVEKPDAGRILVDGRDLWTDEAAARRSLAYLPEHPDVTPYATILELVRLVCRLRGEPPSKGGEALDVFGLGPYARRSIRELSLGQRRRAVFAAAWVGTPAHLLLDEPLEGMDRKIREEILAWLAGRLAGGATALVVSHDLEPFHEMATSAVGLKEGGTRPAGILPADRTARLAFLDRLARGEW